MDWKDWPQEKRDAAAALLSPTEWQGFIKSMPSGGTLKRGDTINAPDIVISGTDGTKVEPGTSYTVPSKSPSPSGSKDKPYKFPPHLDKELDNKQKFRLLQRVRRGNLTTEDIDRGKFRTIPDDPNNKKCFYTELTKHLGDTPDYPNHGQYATQVTGSLGDLFMMTPDGINFANYDGIVKENGTAATYGLETAGAVAEVKTQHNWLIKVVNGNPLNETETEKYDKLQKQLGNQAKVAQQCKLRYFIAFEKEDVARIAGPLLVRMLYPEYPEIRVHYIPFDKPSSLTSLKPSMAEPLANKLTLPQMTYPVAQQYAKGKLAVALEVLFNKHDDNHSKLADNQFATEGQSPSKASQLSKSTPNGGQRDLGGWNNGEPDGKHSELTLLEP